jgi:hypothetical protein
VVRRIFNSEVSSNPVKRRIEFSLLRGRRVQEGDCCFGGLANCSNNVLRPIQWADSHVWVNGAGRQPADKEKTRKEQLAEIRISRGSQRAE